MSYDIYYDKLDRTNSNFFMANFIGFKKPPYVTGTIVGGNVVVAFPYTKVFLV